MKRRDFLTSNSTAAGLLAAAAAIPSSAKAARPDTIVKRWPKANGKFPGGKRPNVLWVQTDEQRPDSLGCYGSDWASTPNIDAVAARGTVFTECHVQSPVCVPSRSSMLFSKYPQELNIYENSKAFKDGFIDPSAKTWVNCMADAGYRTVSIGKWHTPNHETWQENYLFDIFHGVADYYKLNGEFAGQEEKYRVVNRPSERWPVIIGGVYPYHDYGVTPATYKTDMAIEKLQEMQKGDAPWLLRVSYLFPHTPVLPPKPWDKLYDSERFKARAVNRSDYETRSDYDQWLADFHGGFKLDKDTWALCAADYHGLCAHVDDEFGRLLQELEKLGELDNTIIAFNTDHGRSLGEAGHTEKGTYDREVWRTPFVFSCPGLIPEGKRDDQLCELLDFGATITDLCGVSLEEDMRGRNVFTDSAPESVFGIIEIGPYRRAGVRNGKYRLDCTVAYKYKLLPETECDPNLFDVQNDPFEENNLAKNPEYAPEVKEMYQKLREWLKTTDPKAYSTL
jgi:choline-sulfatase